jgi:hypothetical protein
MWTVTTRTGIAAGAIADRHYNRQKPGARQFVPPGRCLVLLSDHAVWATSWPFAQYVHHAWGGAWVNSLFRREEGCPYLASDLIRAAVAATRARWPEVPDLGMVTFVDPAQVRRKRDPGRCYLRAGFHLVGRTQELGLLAFQLLPDEMPEPCAAAGAQGSLFG